MRRRFIIGASFLVSVVLGVLAMALLARSSDGPLGPLPGGPLVSGEWATAPSDWSQYLETGALVELEVAGDRSVTTTTIVQQGVLYVPSTRAASKTWPSLALAHPEVVMRHDGQRYAMKIERLTDPEAIGAVARAWNGEAPGDPLQHTTWFFRLE